MPSSAGVDSSEGSAAARERAAALIGRTLSDRYRIVDLVAMGGMGAVYRAEHLLMRKHVAVKVLHPEVEGFPELVARFEREAVAGAHIDHPNVVTASDFGKFDGGSCFLVLEFIRGTTLRSMIDRGSLPARRVAWIIRQVAAGLAAVHAKGIVHRDIKPKNIMIVDDTRRTRRMRHSDLGTEDLVKLIDFGLAKVPVEELSAIAQDSDNPRRSLTAAGVVMGTVGYLAPEAALGTRAILAPADLYALGVIFYEMLCGKRLFEGSDAVQVFSQHRHAPVPPLADRNPEVVVPPAVEAIVRRLLEKDPADRYASAKALGEALDDVLDEIPKSGGAALPALPQPSSDSASAVAMSGNGARSRRAIWVGAGLAAAVALVAVVATRSGSGDAPATTPAASSTGSAPSAAAAASETAARPPAPQAPAALDRLRAAADSQDPDKSVAAVMQLADGDPGAFADRAVQAEVAAIVMAAGAKTTLPEPLFDRLTHKLGSDGLDVLYDLVAREQRATDPRAGITRPTGAGPRARAILGKPEVLLRASAAMRVAYELRRASCQHRPNLFPLAGRVGDDRALEILKSMQPPACSRKDACCLEKNRELERAITDIQARLRK